MQWSFVRIIDTRKVRNLTSSGFRVKSFGISSFADFQGSIHKYLHKPITSHYGTYFIARVSIWTYGSTNHDAIVLHDLRSDKTNTPNVRITIFLAEPQPLRKMSAHHVTI